MSIWSADTGISTIPDLLREAADARSPGLVFHLADGRVPLGAADLEAAADDGARTLAARGVQPGQPIGVLGPNRPQWAVAAYAIWRAGAVVVPLPVAARVRDPEAYVEQVRSLLRAASCSLVLADPRLVPLFPDVAVAWDLTEERPSGRLPAPPTADDVAVIQFTSGSTAAPKGVVLTHRSIVAALDSARAHAPPDLRGAGAERFAAWLPLFHDYGLFGYLVRPFHRQAACHLLPTERFIEDPLQWFRLMGDVGATISSGPSSAWAATVRLLEARPDGVDLSAARCVDMAAETIDPSVVDRVVDVAGRVGLDPRALIGGYGMAEVTLGISGGRYWDAGFRIDDVDLDRLVANGEAEPSSGERRKRVASCGVALPGIDIRIVRPGGDGTVPERVVGDIEARAPGAMRGYLAPRGDEEPFTPDGWLRTGDLGYLAGGELYLTGRRKEIIIAMGRNYAPDDLEWAAGRLPEIRTGRVVAFGRPDGREADVVVVVEPAGDADPAALPAMVREAVADAVGFAPRGVVVVAPGAVPKTTSGKLRRAAVREAYERGQLQREALAVSDATRPSSLGGPRAGVR